MSMKFDVNDSVIASSSPSHRGVEGMIDNTALDQMMITAGKHDAGHTGEGGFA